MNNFIKTLILFIFTIALSLNAAPLHASDNSSSEDYTMGDVSTLPADFNLVVTASKGPGQVFAGGTIVVDRTCIFRLSQPADADPATIFDVSLFEDNTFSRMYPNRTLPFTTKMNFRGIKDGSYQLIFVARDKNGRTGKGIITVQVHH